MEEQNEDDNDMILTWTTPLLVMRLSVYHNNVSPNEAFEMFGGTEQYSESSKHLVWAIDSPETAQELLMKAIEKYKDKATALSWFAYVDKAIQESDELKPTSIERFAFTYCKDTPQYDIYANIEKSWIESHGFTDDVETFKNAVGKLDAMKGATDRDWNDAFILNADNAYGLGNKLHYKRYGNILESWKDLIDDLMLIYMGIQIYVGVRKYGSVEGYAI